MESVPGAIATGAQASSLAITRRRYKPATGTVALQSDPVATAPGTDLILKLRHCPWSLLIIQSLSLERAYITFGFGISGSARTICYTAAFAGAGAGGNGRMV